MSTEIVKFHDTDIYAFRVGDLVLIALKPIVQGMGLSWHGQLERVKRDPLLREGIRIMRIPSKRGGLQKSVCLPLDLVHGWFFRIESDRIKKEAVREKVLVFQRECYDVLAAHFRGERDIALPNSVEYERLSIGLAHEARLIFGRRAGAQVWKIRGLPTVPAMDDAFRQLELFDRP
jgi:hypothetical protein